MIFEITNPQSHCRERSVSESDPKERNELESQLSTMGNALAHRHSGNNGRFHATGIAQVSSHLWDKQRPVVVVCHGIDLCPRGDSSDCTMQAAAVKAGS